MLWCSIVLMKYWTFINFYAQCPKSQTKENISSFITVYAWNQSRKNWVQGYLQIWIKLEISMGMGLCFKREKKQCSNKENSEIKFCFNKVRLRWVSSICLSSWLKCVLSRGWRRQLWHEDLIPSLLFVWI